MGHKNKYIKLFENFKEDNMFDYTIDDIKNILKIRKVKFNDVEYLDSGNYGNVFDLKNGNILKITSMKSEVYYANKIKDIDSKYFVNIHDVFFHNYSDMGYNITNGFIIMEKLDMESNKRFKHFVDFLNSHNSIADRYKTISDENVINFFNEKMVGLTDDEILNLWNIYKKIRIEIDKYDLSSDDLRGGNIGYRNTTPVFFDISDVHKIIEHDYSDIDVLKYKINI